MTTHDDDGQHQLFIPDERSPNEAGAMLMETTGSPAGKGWQLGQGRTLWHNGAMVAVLSRVFTGSNNSPEQCDQLAALIVRLLNWHDTLTVRIHNWPYGHKTDVTEETR